MSSKCNSALLLLALVTLGTWLPGLSAGEEALPAPQVTKLKMTNRKSGISLLFSGINGKDFAANFSGYLVIVVGITNK